MQICREQGAERAGLAVYRSTRSRHHTPHPLLDLGELLWVMLLVEGVVGCVGMWVGWAGIREATNCKEPNQKG